ncbi:MAG: alternative ribosome rescue aminoacyl-tRNA hydrolase ArfB [Acidobacteriota bacterium]
MRLSPQLVIPERELRFEASRGGGPGGQHVNTSSTRVTVLFDVMASPSLDDGQKARIAERLRHRMSKAGVVSVSSHGERSQLMNRRSAEERLRELLQEALQVPVERRATRVPRRSRVRRLVNKKRRSGVKAGRARPSRDDD